MDRFFTNPKAVAQIEQDLWRGFTRSVEYNQVQKALIHAVEIIHEMDQRIKSLEAKVTDKPAAQPKAAPKKAEKDAADQS